MTGARKSKIASIARAKRGGTERARGRLGWEPVSQPVRGSEKADDGKKLALAS